MIGMTVEKYIRPTERKSKVRRFVAEIGGVVPEVRNTWTVGALKSMDSTIWDRKEEA